MESRRRAASYDSVIPRLPNIELHQVADGAVKTSTGHRAGHHGSHARAGPLQK